MRTGQAALALMLTASCFLLWDHELKKGRIFMLMAFSEYQLPFQFIHTTPSSVPCLAICLL